MTTGNKSDRVDSSKKNVLIVGCCVIIVAYYLQRFIRTSDPIVQTQNGRVRGRVGISRNSREYFEFLGIPFAKPPVGNLRFQSPQPVENWSGILETRRYRPKCMQVDFISQLKSGTDDCLYLNVFVPKPKTGNRKSDKPLPVLAFIHGGYYVSGQPALYGPAYVMDEDIVLVTISYRVGALGFLNLGIKEARGNQGLKDQVLALKWIQNNIHHFGGDPNLVTIIGQSAGGSSVHFHMLSESSKGLFHRAVSHSGTVLSPWAISYSGKEQALRLAKLLDCPINETATVTLNCLKEKDVNKIVEEHTENLNFLHDPLSVFKPSIEDIQDEDAFLTQDPVEIMSSGNITSRVPWIIGVNSEEGQAVASVLVRDIPLLDEFQKDWRTSFQNLLMYTVHDETVPDKVRSYYFGSQSRFCTQANLANFTKLMSDREYFLGSHQSALYHYSPDTSNSPIYMFYFAQPVPLSFGDVLWGQYGIFPAFVEIGVFLIYHWVKRNIFGWNNPNKGVTHVDDLTFIFHIQNIPEYSGGDSYEKLSKEMVRSWVQFAVKGKPGPILGTEWKHAFSRFDNLPDKSITQDTVPQYLKIRIDERSMVDEPFNDAMRFWKSLKISPYVRSRDEIEILQVDGT